MPHRVSHGRLCFQRAGDATAVLSAYATHPLKLLTPKNHGSGAWVYTGTLGGGMVGGDQIRLDIALEAGARAFVSTQGPTRVYRSALGSSSEVSARVDDGAALFLLPDPVSCFAGATFRQHTEIELSAQGSVACWEILNAGRTAYGKGERWAFDRYRSSLRVQRAGNILIDDALLLDPAHGPLEFRLGAFDALATVFIAGPLLKESCDELRARIDSAPILPGAALLAAASPVGADGLLLRFAARSAELSIDGLTSALRKHLAWVPALLGDDPWARRH